MSSLLPGVSGLIGRVEVNDRHAFTLYNYYESDQDDYEALTVSLKTICLID
ncbi:hypothetical protein [Leptodesmis sichuanensis]|uniref:hypothetical protein n=1 Tax=Leptodesmis sichuanensis TaxID=2906798 RepID=UPI001F30C674|nr:hypothetical protein [Leptodesmis sichuanensis]UIE38663.1 hypothetical protein KIK02_03250 [Leptodesmis sichuanensis A121]